MRNDHSAYCCNSQVLRWLLVACSQHKADIINSLRNLYSKAYLQPSSRHNTNTHVTSQSEEFNGVYVQPTSGLPVQLRNPDLMRCQAKNAML